MRKKIIYLAVGFMAGLGAGCLFSIPESAAQMGYGTYGKSTTGFSTEKLTPAVPAAYGKLVAVSGVNFYFQADNGNVYILRQRTGSDFDSRVTVIERG